MQTADKENIYLFIALCLHFNKFISCQQTRKGLEGELSKEGVERSSVESWLSLWEQIKRSIIMPKQISVVYYENCLNTLTHLGNIKETFPQLNSKLA